MPNLFYPNDSFSRSILHVVYVNSENKQITSRWPLLKESSFVNNELYELCEREMTCTYMVH